MDSSLRHCDRLFRQTQQTRTQTRTFRTSALTPLIFTKSPTKSSSRGRGAKRKGSLKTYEAATVPSQSYVATTQSGMSAFGGVVEVTLVKEVNY